MKFSQDFIEKVREANNIVHLIEQYTQLKHKGDRHLGLCPFPDHNEKSPSFSISETKQVYYCFGCKKSGNIYTFIQQFLGMNFPEAVEYLAQKASIPIPQEMAYFENQNSRKSLYDINELTTQYFHQNLVKKPVTHPVQMYAEQRKLSQEIIDIFKIGYSEDQWEDLVQHFNKNKVSLKEGAQLGLVRERNKNKTGFYDLYRNRLMFPIRSSSGQYIGFGGRSLSDEKPKYINSPDSDIFSKGRILYGLFETSKYIRTADQAIVVEGYMDFMALYQAGLRNVVATLGTALTAHHAKLLRRYTKNVVVLFDGDQAGQTASEKSLPLLLQEELLPKIFSIPNNLDPDDFLQKFGADQLKEHLAHATDLFIHVFENYMQGYRGHSSQKVLIIDKLAEILLSVADPRLKELYVNEVADRLNVEPKLITQSPMPGNKSKRAPQPLQKKPKITKTTTPPDLQDEEEKIRLRTFDKTEYYLLNLALKRKENFDLVAKDEVLKQFSSQEIIKIFHMALELNRQMPNEFDKLSASLSSKVDPPRAVLGYLDKPLSELDMEREEQLLKDCLKKVEERSLKSQIQDILAQLKNQDLENEQKLLEKVTNIKKQLKRIKIGTDHEYTKTN